MSLPISLAPIVRALTSVSYAPLLRPLDTSALWKFQDVVYTQTGHSKHSLDVFLRPPERQAAKRPLQPCLMFIHGGSWQRGSKRLTLNLYENVAAVACAAGGVGVTIDYRLSPEVTFPTHLEDCAAALRWVQGNIAQYGGDPDRVILCGHSAGAHLATLLALRANTRCNSLGVLPTNSASAAHSHSLPATVLRPVRGLIGISGVYNLLRIGTSPFGPALTEPAFGRDEAVLRAASPPYALMDVASAATTVESAAVPSVSAALASVSSLADARSTSPSLSAPAGTAVGGDTGHASASGQQAASVSCDLSALSSLPVLLLNASEDFHLAADAEELDMVLQLLQAQQQGSQSGTADSASSRASALLAAVKSAAPGIQWAAPAALGRRSGVARGVVPSSNHVTIVGALGQPGDAASAAVHAFVQGVALA